jgi:hypothetical protein
MSLGHIAVVMKRNLTGHKFVFNLKIKTKQIILFLFYLYFIYLFYLIIFLFIYFIYLF